LPPKGPNFWAAVWSCGSSISLNTAQHIAQYSDVCVGFRLQTLCLVVSLQSFIVFKLRLLEGTP
jgi:hypothetical protein